VNQPSLSFPSFAKINWSLQILGRRPDGYHDVETVLQTISLHDDLRFDLAPDSTLTLTCDDPGIPTGGDNLIIKAARTLQQRYNVDRGAHIHLSKTIPTEAGLGGASSNAAVSLLALTRIWDIDVSRAELNKIAAALGADVPFFLIGGAAHATGTGTEVSPLVDDVAQHLIVVKPHASVSTAQAYAALSASRSSVLTTSGTTNILAGSADRTQFRDSRLSPQLKLRNDFEEVIFDMEPEIGRAKTALLRAGANSALLAGSGSSVFGIFNDRNAQERALQEIKPEVGWRIFACVTVSRTEYDRALSFDDK
jgi:4-diphosphocytidyl-2-C-methyl-D-erythritol kinase